MGRPKSEKFWWGVIALLIIIVSTLHYTTPTSKAPLHLIYLQSYFIPVLIAAFQFGVRGGLGVAVAISLIYMPHIMLQWLGNTEHMLWGILQIIMFNVIGYLTGLKAQKEQDEKHRFRQTAAELEQSLKKLERQSNELAEMEEQLRLSDRLAVVGELTTSLAHELRNPLGTIRGAVEILTEELPPEAQKTEFFQMLIQETERMSSVVENYLTFARRPKNPDSQYDVGEILQSACRILAARARKAQIELRTTLPAQPVILKGDPNHLRQVLVNLLLNAIEAMPEPGVIAISAQLQDKQEKSSEPGAGEPGSGILQLMVKDQGTGIAQDALDTIFTPFYTTKEKGTGLGLSIVKRIIDQQHWQIAFHSRLRQGTEVVLTIPLKS
ncbi:MAG: HAMP domain-containing histidine kinase [Calditrichaeota bacterium]|nr:HAMP domain-containing histidine kinase [Calditrichota bacterium]